MKTYRQSQYRNNIQFRLSQVMRVRVRDALDGKTKSTSTTDLVGCTVEELKNHLGTLFEKEMNWDNFGAWHIDHILPCKMFNLALESEQRKCFHWSNLQPLWAKDNIRKGGTFDPEEDTLMSIYLLFE